MHLYEINILLNVLWDSHINVSGIVVVVNVLNIVTQYIIGILHLHFHTRNLSTDLLMQKSSKD